MAVFVYRGYYLPSSSLALYGNTQQLPYGPSVPRNFLFWLFQRSVVPVQASHQVWAKMKISPRLTLTLSIPQQHELSQKISANQQLSSVTYMHAVQGWAHAMPQNLVLTFKTTYIKVPCTFGCTSWSFTCPLLAPKGKTRKNQVKSGAGLKGLRSKNDKTGPMPEFDESALSQHPRGG